MRPELPRGHGMIVLWLAATLASAQTAFESETIAQVRHDLFGQPIVPVNQYFRLTDRGRPVDVDAYLAAEWHTGLEGALDPSLFLLRVGRDASWGGWSVGRQQALTVLRPQTFDGARLALQPTERLEVSAWGGMARHHDLDDLAEGAAMGRMEMKVHADGAVWRAGVEVVRDASLRVQEDLEALFVARRLRSRPEARALVVMAGDDLRWAKVQLAASPWAGVRSTVHVQRRYVEDPKSLLGETLVAAFAPGGVDEAGVALRVSNRSWSAWSGSYTLARYEIAGTPVLGHAADVSFAPSPRGALRLVPAYRVRTGPGGSFHAAYLTGFAALGRDATLQARFGWVPYQKLHQPWRTAVAAGLQAAFELAPLTQVRASLDAASDAVFAFDVRGGAAVVVGFR